MKNADGDGQFKAADAALGAGHVAHRPCSEMGHEWVTARGAEFCLHCPAAMTSAAQLSQEAPTCEHGKAFLCAECEGRG